MSANNKLKQTLTLIYTSIHTERLRTIEMCDLTTFLHAHIVITITLLHRRAIIQNVCVI